MSRNDPMLILAMTDPSGKAPDSPLFAAVRVTASLCKKLRSLAHVAKKHGVSTMSVRHQDAPIYWDFPPGSGMEGCMEEYSQWRMAQSTLLLELWGRIHVGDGGFSETELLAVATVINVEVLEALRTDRCEVHYVEDAQTKVMLGEPFALAVHERFVAISKLRESDMTG